MKYLRILARHLLLEQDNKLAIIRKAITERIPVSIYYRGPAGEVREGQRLDIEPVVLGTNARSGNLVIWAYVFKGISKRGIPNWKMFRIDRITSAKLNPNGQRFNLDDLPGYVEGKAPNMMKSLSSVDVFSPYWFDDEDRYIEEPVHGQPPPQPEVPAPEQPAPPREPELPPSQLANKVYGELNPYIRDEEGQQIISKNDYNTALNNFSGYQEDQWRLRQRTIGANERPGEGTRKRFNDTSKFELDKLLAQNNIKVDDPTIAESVRIQSRIKRLINW